MKSLWYHYLLHDFTMNTPFFSRIRYLFREFSITNSLCNEFSITNSISLFRKFTILSRLYYLFTICFAILLGIHHLFREFTIRFANSPWIHFSATMIHYLIRVSLWIHYLIREFTICFAFHYEDTIFFANSLSASRFLFKFFICFSNSPWIHYLFLRNHY